MPEEQIAEIKEDAAQDVVEAVKDVEATDAPEEVTDATEQATEETTEATEASETVVTFDDDEESEPEGDTEWIKKLRKRNRDQAKRISELEQQSQPAPVEEQLGPVPTLESVDYDEEQYSKKLADWLGKRDKAQNIARQQKADADKQTESWNNRLGEYEKAAKDEFDSDVYADAEEIVKSALDATQQGIMVHAFGGKLAQLIMGLSKSDKRLQELAKIKDTVLFSVAVGKLESKMKVTKRRPNTRPESRISSNTQGVATTGDVLEKLREDAVKTGNYTKVIAHRAKLRNAN